MTAFLVCLLVGVCFVACVAMIALGPVFDVYSVVEAAKVFGVSASVMLCAAFIGGMFG